MTFKNWLIQIVRSEGTADKYSSAVSGVISKWAQEFGLSSSSFDDVGTIAELVKIFDDLNSIDIYVDRNKHGNNMYSCALKAYIEFRKCDNTEELEQDISNIVNDDSIIATEKVTFINTRIGQGKYRNKLIGYWEKCALTGFEDVRFLVSSHIKPWRDSDNKEKLDHYNGLLLLPNLDKVFDLGFITFSEQGKIVVSDYLEEPKVLGITLDMRLALKPEHLTYIKFHRTEVFEKHI